ncbi:hypothetical protein RIF29_38814 [Crotalaria pallida]|uniref:Legume lectin domain-containing protein n=1 Tax=Crotalaria pallida TaxID=3830 RepID=A0AAN9E0I5_CROPI
MAHSNTKPTQVHFTLFTTFFLLLLNKVNSSANELSFTINKFFPNQKDLLFQGDASVNLTGVLQVTKVLENGEPSPSSVGRARYIAPIQIWDSTTGRVASFTTSFSFIVRASNNSIADGLAFFLAPPDSEIPSDWLSRFLGLFSSPSYNSSYQIVAAEFDTYFHSPWDPNYRHIGIDVNIINSITTARWDCRNGEVANVIITYRAPTKTLTIDLSYPFDQTSAIVTGYVDLKEVLPEWVNVGFSAATGRYNFETHEILSWSFNTYWEDGSDDIAIENDMNVAARTA